MTSNRPLPSTARGALILGAISAVSAFAFACGRDEASPGDRGDTSAVLRVGSPIVRPVPRDTVAAVQVQWTVAEILERLRSASIPRELRGEVRQPFLAVRGARISVPGGEIQVFLYGDAGAAGRDVARLDTSRVAPPNVMISWVAPPSLIWHNNMVAILLTRDARLRARITQSLEPGAHQSVPSQP